MAEVDYIKTINDRLDNIEKTFSEGKDDSFSVIIKNSIYIQLEIFKKAKQNANKKIKSTKESLKKLYKKHKDNIQNILTTNLYDIKNNKCMKMFLNSVKSIFTGSKKLLKSFKNKIVSLLKGVFDIMSSVKTYIFDKIKSTFSIFNKLFFGIPGKTWSAIKFIFKTTYKALSWVLHIGKLALDFVWSGVKTIFNIGFSAVSTTISYLAKGTKAFFGWWFKMLINTIFNPSMWLINIPLFIIISSVVFSAFALVLVASAGIILPIFEISFDILKVVGGWIYNGISWLFDWIVNKYNGSFLETNIITPLVNYISKNIPDYIKNIYGNVIEWGTNAFNWISNKGSSVIESLKDTFNSIQKAYNNYPGKTAFQKFLILLLDASWDLPFMGTTITVPLLPPLASRIIEEKFGFILPYKGSSHSVYSRIKNVTQSVEKRLIEATVEAEYIKIFKENQKTGTSISSIDIEKELNKTVIPELAKSVAKTIGEKSFKDSILTAIINAQGSYLNSENGELKTINPAVIQGLAFSLSKLRVRKQLIESGQLDATSEYVFEDMVNTVNEASNKAEDIRERINLIKAKDNTAQDTIKLINQYIKKDLLTSKLAPLETIKENEKNADDRNIVTKMADVIVNQGVLGWQGFGVPEAKKSEYAQIISNTDSIINPATLEKKAHGDIVIPNRVEMSKTIALDTRGINFIRAKVKDIIAPMTENKKEKKDQPNITIIEETQNYVESYEIYTMSQLSKGILRN